MVATPLLPMLLHVVHRFCALRGVGGVDIEEENVAASRLDLVNHLVDVRHRGATVEVHTENIQSRLGQFEAGGLAKAA